MIQFGSATYSVAENSGSATITVTRLNGSLDGVSVEYAASNGTATAGSDYQTTTGTLVFAAGQQTNSFEVPIVNDIMGEMNETVNLVLRNPSANVGLNLSCAVLTVEDDDGLPVALPINLIDGSSYQWDIERNGSILDGSSDAYDGGHVLSGFPDFINGLLVAGGREIIIGPATNAGVQTTRRIYIPASQAYARFMEIVSNIGVSTVTNRVKLDTNLGSDFDTVLVMTSDGDTTFELNDNWIVTDDMDGAGDPTVLHAIANNHGHQRPSAVSYSMGLLGYEYQLVLQPGETKIVMHFGAQNMNRNTALNKASQLIAMDLDTLAGISEEDLARIVNFGLPNDLQVTPTTAFESSGHHGGPFSPSNAVYTLSNVGTGSIAWTATCSSNWINLTPSGGTLAAGASGVVTVRISSVANQLRVGAYGDMLTFSNRTSGAIQQRRVSLDVMPTDIYFFPLETNPGWQVEEQWAFGQPQGLSGDPSSGHTGSNVYGYNLAGSYSNNMSVYYLTMGPLDCSRYEKVGLRFWQWLGVENAYFDHANVQASADGTNWVTVWEHTGNSFQDTSWQEMSYDISAVADRQPTVYIRWGMGTTDALVVYSGWNIDDIAIMGEEIESLQVSPERRLYSGGHPGGPFSPSNAIYMVSNVGTGRIAWTADSAQNWVTVTPSSGTLEVGASAAVKVTINGQAATLPEGIHSNTVIFSNVTTTLTQTRQVTLTVFTFAPTIYVNAGNTNGIEDGTAAHPYRTIGRGVTNAAAGSIIQVAAGVYAEQANLRGKYGITLVGAGASTIVTNAGHKFLVEYSSEITIQGFKMIGGSNGVNIVNSSGVALFSNVIENVSQDIYGYGGAVIGSGSSIRMNGNTIQDCYGGQMGGAGYFVNCSLEISDNDFLNDTAWNSAGGIYLRSDRAGNSAKLHRNLFSDCQADYSGAMDIRGSQIDQIEIFNNSLTRCGAILDFFNRTGAIRLDIGNATSTAQIVNNVIHDPIVGLNAQRVDVYVRGAAPAYVANNIFSGCGGYSVYGDIGSHVTAEYNCNSESSYNNVTVGSGTITNNPRFVNPDTWDFRLMTGSACIDAGNPDASYNDLDGTRNDMGVFGGFWSGVTNGGIVPITTNTIYVNACNTNGIEDGTAAHPYRTIGRGVTNAAAGSIIQVAAGVYAEQVNLRGKYDITLIGAGASIIVTNSGCYNFRVDFSSEITIRGFNVIGGSSGIIVNSSDVALFGNVIENVSQGDYGYGGAVIGSGSSLRMSGNRIQNCYGGQMGGAGYFVNCSLEISDNDFLNDTAWNSAGGIYVRSDRVGNSVKMYRNLFDNCQADYSGAIDIRGSQIDRIEIFNNILTRCGADYSWAGAIRLGVSSAASTAQVVNNVIHGAIGGVGVYVNGFAPVYVANNIFSGFNGYSVYGDSGSHVTAEYNCNNGNGYSGVTVGPGTITDNPMFVNPGAGDFHLQTNSACIDAGNPAASYNDTDGTRNDMGAFGGLFSMPRQVWVASATGAAGGRVTVPIELAALGDENSLSFSITYDSIRLSNPQVTLGADATSASLMVNTQQMGQVGVMLWLSPNQTFAAGDLDLVRVAFAIASSAPAGATPIALTDRPAERRRVGQFGPVLARDMDVRLGERYRQRGFGRRRHERLGGGYCGNGPW